MLAAAEVETIQIMSHQTPVLPSTALSRLDFLGAMTALLCAIHCALLPLAASLLPLAGLVFLSGEVVEWLLLGASAVLALTSLRSGYRRHRSRWPLYMLGLATVLMALGHFGHSGHHVAGPIPDQALLVASGLLLATAHVINSWLDRRLWARVVAVSAAAVSSSASSSSSSAASLAD